MTNREWLLKKMQNMSDKQIAEMLDRDWNMLCLNTKKCLNNCTECKAEWLKQEHKEKITLTEAEKVIIEAVGKEYSWIARNEDEELFIYAKMPEKGKSFWISNGINLHFCMFNHLFQFVRCEDEEPYNIEKLLELSDED